MARSRLCLVVQKKDNVNFCNGGFRITNQKRVRATISTRTRAEARTKKERVKKVLILNLDFQPRKRPVKRDIVMPGKLVFQLN